MEQLKMIFKRFAKHEAHDKSPLYAYWCERIVENEALLRLIQHIPANQPKPNLFFAAVQYVSQQQPSPLQAIFVAPERADLATSFDTLVAFCAKHEATLLELFQSKLVQTNEVQRASYLYPIFSKLYKRANKPLTLIEIGTSAGLLLNIDHYRYEIAQQPPITYGNRNSTLTLHAQNFGDPIVHVEKPHIVKRIGIDLQIVDLQDEQQYSWLQSLIWPELKVRKRNLAAARTIHMAVEKQLFTGDFTKLIPQLIEDPIVHDSQLVIFHTHVANQFPAHLKESLLDLLDAISKQQSIYHVYNNMFPEKTLGNLYIDLIENGQTTRLQKLVNTDGHGNYFSWCELEEEVQLSFHHVNRE